MRKSSAALSLYFQACRPPSPRSFPLCSSRRPHVTRFRLLRACYVALIMSVDTLPRLDTTSPSPELASASSSAPALSPEPARDDATTPTAPAATPTTAIPTPAQSERSSSQLRQPIRSDTDSLAEVPKQLKDGVSMLKVSAKKVQQRRVRIAPEVGQVFWESRHAGQLNVEAIRELRFGADAKGFREALGRGKDAEARWTSIIYASSVDKKIKVLHLVALTDDIFAIWKTTLIALYDQRKALMGGLDQMRRRQSVWLRQHWKMADASGDERLSFTEVVNLCGRLGIAARTEELKTNFELADTQGRGHLDFADFQSFVRLLKSRPEVQKLAKEVAEGAERITSAQFTTFLRTTQQSQLNDEAIVAIYRKYCDEEAEGMSVDGFTSFLLSTENAAFSEQGLKPTQDMSRPLCEYFISSSHNVCRLSCAPPSSSDSDIQTYLVGNQLNGESTTEGYVRALQQGCRTVERAFLTSICLPLVRVLLAHTVDVWDGPTGQPVIYHGRTLTSKVLVRDVLMAIAKYAFVASHYPVILSIEVHCETAQQDRLAQSLKEVLGEALVAQPLRDDEDSSELPSPEALKYRFLVKAKNLFSTSATSSVVEEPVSIDSGDVSSSSMSSDSTDLRGRFGSALRRFRSTSSRSSSASSARSTPEPSPSLGRKQSGDLVAPALTTAEAGKAKMSMALAALLVYTIGVKCRGFNKKEQYAPQHVLSLGERRAAKTIKDAADELISHNRTHLTRAYPAATRFTSSNYLPHNMWAVGMQMVAINWQTFGALVLVVYVERILERCGTDLGAEINAAMFQRNARIGYVLKPDVLRAKGALKDKDLLVTPHKYTLHVTVRSIVLAIDR